MGRVIVITGSTRGIGFGLATEFLKLGHKVVFNGTTEASLSKSLLKLNEFSSQLIGVPGDVTELSTHQQLFNAAIEKFGKVDIWINNAGISTSNKLAVALDKSEIIRL